MIEHIPTIALDNEDRLTIRFGELVGRRQESIEELEGRANVLIDENTGTAVIADVVELIDTTIEGEHINFVEANTVVRALGMLMDTDTQEGRDHVFGVSPWERGVSVDLYPQGQHWLNNNGFSEDLAKSVIRAMALPFPEEVRQDADASFNMTGDRWAGAHHRLFTFGTRQQDFSFWRLTEEGIREDIEVSWADLGMSTLGNCACLGSAGDERRDHILLPEIPILYNMSPHNIDGGNQALSLTLGLARLSHEAAQYEAVDDIFEGSEWEVSGEASRLAVKLAEMKQDKLS